MHIVHFIYLLSVYPGAAAIFAYCEQSCCERVCANIPYTSCFQFFWVLTLEVQVLECIVMCFSQAIGPFDKDLWFSTSSPIFVVFSGIHLDRYELCS